MMGSDKRSMRFDAHDNDHSKPTESKEHRHDVMVLVVSLALALALALAFHGEQFKLYVLLRRPVLIFLINRCSPER